MTDPVMTPRSSAPAAPAISSTPAGTARAAAFLAIAGALLMVAGAGVWQSTGADLDAALAADEVAAYLADAGDVTGRLVANLTLWMIGVLVLGAAGTAMERLPSTRPLAARLGLFAFWVAVPLALAAFTAWLALVVQASGAAGPETVAVAEVVGWFASRADWVATVLIVAVAPVLMSVAGYGTWAPKWLLSVSIAAGLAGLGTIVAMFTDNLSGYGFLVVPLGLLWMFGAGVALLRGES